MRRGFNYAAALAGRNSKPEAMPHFTLCGEQSLIPLMQEMKAAVAAQEQPVQWNRFWNRHLRHRRLNCYMSESIHGEFIPLPFSSCGV